MKKYYLAFIIMFVAGSFPVFAQTISSQKGLTTAVFNVPAGIIKVYLPDDIRPGDQISGSIVLEAGGKNAGQSGKKLAELKKYTVDFNGQKFPVSEGSKGFQCNINNSIQSGLPLSLLNINGVNTAQVNIQSPANVKQQAAGSGCKIPTHTLTGAPLRITGPFDGNSSNTNCNVEGKQIEILAESPRQCVVFFPETAKGNQNIEVQEKNQPKCSQQVSGVELNVTAGKLNLLKGEKTYVNVEITGLQNLQDTALLTLVNITPDIVIMQPANIFKILLIPDSVKSGVYNKLFNIQSIKTGNFSVNVNLELEDIMADMPENYPNPFTGCNCRLGVELVKRTANNPRPTFSAVILKACDGQDCQELSLDKKWEVFSGKENADIVDERDNKTVITLQPKQEGKFILKFSATLSCKGGKSCTAVKYCNEKGEEVNGPQTETEHNGETETPGNETNSRCVCNASCSITRGEPKNQQVTYAAVIKSACTGTSGSGSSRSVCSVGPITYLWKIGESGKDVAEIVGKNNEASVTVKEKKEGNYTLYLGGLVTCTDGTSCEFNCAWEQSVPPPGSTRACMPSLTHDIGPLMNGGLSNYFRGAKNTKLIRRDDFVALEAAGADVDLAILDCKKLYECPDAGCNKEIPIAGRVRFEWTILPGVGELGSLVQIGCIPDDKKAKGEHVIFKPPFIPLPVSMKGDTTVETQIVLSIIDDGSAVKDPTVNKTITIKTTRKTTNPDFYEVEISGAEYKPATKTTSSKPGCACNPIGPDWKPGDDLKKPDIILPKASSTNNKIVSGQWMVLTTSDQRDKDLAAYKCQSSSSCPVGSISREYEDIVLWNWTVKGGGEILFSHEGQYVIYAAPLDLPKDVDSIDITITLKVYNPGGRADPEKSVVSEKIIRVYRPGIKLSYPPQSWLPEDTNHVSIKSELVYRSGKGWLPALDHMCRILYFELMDISHEKGVCMNDPLPDKADQCFDLQLEPGDNLEAFAAPDPVKGTCSRTDQHMQGRTIKPVKEHTLRVSSLDFGAYGFLRSFANINYGISVTKEKGELTARDKGRDKPTESPSYTSIPWLKAEVPHPLFGGRGKSKIYTDNRVTLPYDADENHVADAGWTTAGDVKIDDPPFVFNEKRTDKELKDARRKDIDLFPDNDRENLPPGDGFRGDGLGSYEEYRGFRVKLGDELKQIRTNPEVKDIFVYNPDKFSLKLYKSVSGLDVYEITEDQYGGTSYRVVNFNYTPITHIVDQRGLYLVDEKDNDKLLGIAISDNGMPAIPNYIVKVVIYRNKVNAISDKFGLDPDDKLAAVVAHELMHANNVCHHGEGNEAVEKSHDVLHGLRSGDIYCVMHYDNSGNIRDKNYNPEPTGNKLCTSPAGTGYNLPKNNTGNAEDGHLFFGDALEGRGSCALQIRISGRGERPTQCGNRFDEKGELKNQFKRKKAK